MDEKTQPETVNSEPMSFADVLKKIRTMKTTKEYMRPTLVRIEMGVSEFEQFRQKGNGFGSMLGGTENQTIWGVPFVVLPVESHWRVVTADDEPTTSEPIQSISENAAHQKPYTLKDWMNSTRLEWSVDIVGEKQDIQKLIENGTWRKKMKKGIEDEPWKP